MKTPHSGKKILYVAPYFAPAWSYGGPVKVSYEFAKELIRLGNQVTVATTDALDSEHRNSKAYEELDGIKIFRFKNISNILAKSYNLYAPIGFSRWLKKNLSDFDIVHIHEFFTVQSIISSKTCSKMGKPFVVQPHGSLLPYAKNSRFKFIKRVVMKYFANLALSSQAIIVLTDKEKRDVSQIYPSIKSKIKIVANGIDCEELRKIKKIDLHKIFGIPKDNKIVAYLGRLHFQKGLDLVIKALALIKDEIAVTLLVIGPDEGAKKSLMKQAEELGVSNQIIFAGMMTGKKKLETLKSAELSILLSRSEGLPTTLLESAGLGLPIVCSRGSNMPEIVTYKLGFIVNSEQQAADGIKKILCDKQLSDDMSKNALRLAKCFDIKKQTVELAQIYESSL